jgi:hypothetical protein
MVVDMGSLFSRETRNGSVGLTSNGTRWNRLGLGPRTVSGAEYEAAPQLLALARELDAQADAMEGIKD